MGWPRFRFACVSFTVGMVMLSPISRADAGASGEELVSEVRAVKSQSRRDVALGELVAEELGQVLGIGLSPALGLAAVGFWHHYVNERPVQRWYTSPWFIWAMATLAGLVAAKDVIGSVFGPAKQVADAAEVIMNKGTGAIGLVATAGYAMDSFGAPMAEVAQGVMDLVVPVAHAATVEGGETFMSSAADTAGGILASLLGSVAYVAVWLTSQTFNVAVMLNPFSLLDPFLKAARLSLVGCVAGACYLSPWLGIPVCVVYLLIAFALVGFCTRMLSFGTVMAWDILLFRNGAEVDTEDGVLSFAGRGLEGVPSRSLGRLRAAEGGERVFSYRPLLLFPRREVSIPCGDLYLIEGAFFPSLKPDSENQGRSTLMLAPRYRERAEVLVEVLGLAGVGTSWLERAKDQAGGLVSRLWGQMKALPGHVLG